MSLPRMPVYDSIASPPHPWRGRGSDRRYRLPGARVLHGGPGFARRQRLTALQELDGNTVRRTYERHSSVAGRTIDCHSRVHQALTDLVNIRHTVRKMAEISTAGVLLRIPVIGQLDHGRGRIAASSLGVVRRG